MAKLERLAVPSIGKDTKELELSYAVGENVKTVQSF